MKIERISDNQIRCTLNKNDLLDRELRISELAYGTEKAKALFKEYVPYSFLLATIIIPNSMGTNITVPKIRTVNKARANTICISLMAIFSIALTNIPAVPQSAAEMIINIE